MIIPLQEYEGYVLEDDHRQYKVPAYSFFAVDPKLCELGYFVCSEILLYGLTYIINRKYLI